MLYFLAEVESFINTYPIVMGDYEPVELLDTNNT